MALHKFKCRRVNMCLKHAIVESENGNYHCLMYNTTVQ